MGEIMNDFDNQIKEATSNCLHLHVPVDEYVKIRMDESREQKKNAPPDQELLDWEVDMDENVGMLMDECEQLSFAAEYWKRKYEDLSRNIIDFVREVKLDAQL